MPVTKRSAQMAPRGKFENRAKASGDSQTASLPGERVRTPALRQSSSVCRSLIARSITLATRGITSALLDWIDSGMTVPATRDESWFQALANSEDATAFPDR